MVFMMIRTLALEVSLDLHTQLCVSAPEPTNKHDHKSAVAIEVPAAHAVSVGGPF